jgi:EAL domain-containing protein (putative c-di-GMP-specific phosphodiesterase class I)/CheY-like chemotaxis protein
MRIVASSPIRVLVAEDNAVMRAVLAEFIDCEPTLELIGVVADATQAIAVATSLRPAVALLDVRMPGGGAMAARGIKRCSPGTRVLALSVDSRRARVLEMLAAGADGYLMKDTPFAAIVTAITRAAAGQGSPSVEVTTGVIHQLAQQLGILRSSQETAPSREQRVRHASREGILSVVFEPICSLAGQTVGAEALARFAWGPRQSPDRWFAEARAAGLLVELEIAAARTALAALPALPEPFYLTIRVSPAVLVRDAFRRLLEQADSARVVVEITEQARIDDCQGLRHALATLRAHGTRVAIDSFGVFANARHILRLEPEFIKLDHSLIAGIETPGPRQAIATALIAFGERIGATVIAQGIERAPQVTTLVEFGVRYGQGHVFARPAPLSIPQT